MKMWIGGYPKSGTTWMKFIVTAMKCGKVTPKLAEKIVPNMPEPKKAKRDSWIYKTHCPIPPEGKKVYLVRHPVDICASGVNHVALSSGKTNRDKYVEAFIEKGGNTIGDFGTWDTHIENWIATLDSIIILYEKLIDTTAPLVGVVAAYLGLNGDKKRINAAIKAASFKQMRKMEVAGVKASPGKNVPDVFYNPKHKGYKKGMYFVNKGKYGYARDVLTDKQIERICDRFSKTMTRFGYNGYEGLS